MGRNSVETEMSCPKDGTPYVKIGDKRVCLKCGHVAGYKQISIAEVLQENEILKKRSEGLEAIIKDLHYEPAGTHKSI